MHDLSDICSSFTGRVIESAYQDALLGFHSESCRLAGCQYILIEFRKEFDIDGLTEYVELLEGFHSEDSAATYADQRIEASMAKVLARTDFGGRRWQIDSSRNDSRFYAKKESNLVQGGYFRSFRALNGSGYDIEYVQIEVVQVLCKPILGTEVFSFYDACGEWTSFLIKKGRQTQKC